MTFTKSKAKLELTPEEYAIAHDIIGNIYNLERGEFYDIGACLYDLFFAHITRDDIELSVSPSSAK